MKKIVITAAATLVALSAVQATAHAKGGRGGFSGPSMSSARSFQPAMRMSPVSSFKPPVASAAKFNPGKLTPIKPLPPGKIKFPPGKLDPSKPTFPPGKIKFPPGKLDPTKPTFPPGKGPFDPKPPGGKPPVEPPKPPKPPETGHKHPKGKYWVWGGITILATEYAGCGYEYYKWQSTGSKWWYHRYAVCRGWE